MDHLGPSAQGGGKVRKGGGKALYLHAYRDRKKREGGKSLLKGTKI